MPPIPPILPLPDDANDNELTLWNMIVALRRAMMGQFSPFAGWPSTGDDGSGSYGDSCQAGSVIFLGDLGQLTIDDVGLLTLDPVNKRIGINTCEPATTLDIYSNECAIPILNLHTSQEVSIDFFPNIASTARVRLRAEQVSVGSGGKFRLYTSNSAGTLVERFSTDESAGGVSTITGDLIVTGDLQVNDDARIVGYLGVGFSVDPTFTTNGDLTATRTFIPDIYGSKTGAASGTLTLHSTTNATLGKIIFGTSAYDEVNNRLGIGTQSPNAEAITVEKSFTGGLNNIFRNLSVGSGNFVSLEVANNEGTIGSFLAFSTTFTTSGPNVADGTKIFAGGVGGLSIAAQHASGAIRLYTGGTTERFRVGSAGQFGIGGATFGTAGQYFRSGGAGAPPTWTTISTADLPSNVMLEGEDHGLLGGLLDDDHTQYVLRSILTTRGDLFTRDATGVVRLALGGAGKVLRSDGTDLVYTTAVYPDTIAAGNILYASSTNTISSNTGLTYSNANNLLLVTGTVPAADVTIKVINTGAAGGAVFQVRAAADGAAQFTFVRDSDAILRGRLLYNFASDFINIRVAGIDNVVRIDSQGNMGLNNASPSTQLDIGAGAMEYEEMIAPGNGAANTARLYAVDNGAGKTLLQVIFGSGAAITLATEP